MKLLNKEVTIGATVRVRHGGTDSIVGGAEMSRYDDCVVYLNHEGSYRSDGTWCGHHHPATRNRPEERDDVVKVLTTGYKGTKLDLSQANVGDRVVLRSGAIEEITRIGPERDHMFMGKDYPIWLGNSSYQMDGTYDHTIAPNPRDIVECLGPPVHLQSCQESGLQGLPTADTERKQIRAFTGFVKYFPLAIAEVAKLSKVANEQHNPGSPVHWDLSKSQEELDSLMNHMLDYACGVETDPVDGVGHLVKLAWRAMAQLERKLRGINVQ